LYPDWQKPRRALLLAAVWRDPALNKKKSILVTASSRSATLTEFYRRAVIRHYCYPEDYNISKYNRTKNVREYTNWNITFVTFFVLVLKNKQLAKLE